MLSQHSNHNLVFVFADTNIYLHFKDFDDADWRQVLQTPCTIVVPIVVTRELDKKKDHFHIRIRKRAAKALRWIRTRSRDSRTQNIEVRVQALEPTRILQKHDDLDNTVDDDRLIASALQFLEENPGVSVIVLTDDYGPQLKAEHFGLKVATPSTDLRLPDTKTAEEKELESLRSQLSKAPKLHLGKSRSVSIGPDIGPKQHFVNSRLASERNNYPTDDDSPSELSKIASGTFGNLYESEMVRQYLEDFEDYLNEAYSVLQTCARTFTFDINVFNDGTAPANNVAVFLKLPQSLSWLDDIPDLPKPPRKPRKKGAFGLMKTATISDGLLIPDFLNSGNAANTLTYSGPHYSTDNHEIRFDIDEIMHGIPETWSSLLLIANKLEQHTLSIDYTIHAADLIRPESGTIVVEISSDRSFDNMTQELWSD